MCRRDEWIMDEESLEWAIKGFGFEMDKKYSYLGFPPTYIQSKLLDNEAKNKPSSTNQ